MADGFFVQMEDYNRLLSAEADLAKARADLQTVLDRNDQLETEWIAARADADAASEANMSATRNAEAAIAERDAARADLSEARRQIEACPCCTPPAAHLPSDQPDTPLPTDPEGMLWFTIERAVNEGRNFISDLTDDQAHAVEAFASALLLFRSMGETRCAVVERDLDTLIKGLEPVKVEAKLRALVIGPTFVNPNSLRESGKFFLTDLLEAFTADAALVVLQAHKETTDGE